LFHRPKKKERDVILEFPELWAWDWEESAKLY